VPRPKYLARGILSELQKPVTPSENDHLTRLVKPSPAHTGQFPPQAIFRVHGLSLRKGGSRRPQQRSELLIRFICNFAHVVVTRYSEDCTEWWRGINPETKPRRRLVFVEDYTAATEDLCRKTNDSFALGSRVIVSDHLLLQLRDQP